MFGQNSKNAVSFSCNRANLPLVVKVILEGIFTLARLASVATLAEIKSKKGKLE